MAEFPDTSVEYLAEYQDGTRARGDDTPGGTWFAVGSVYGYPTPEDAKQAVALKSDQLARDTSREMIAYRILRRTTTVEVVQ